MKFFMKTNNLFGLLCCPRNCEGLLTLLLVLFVIGNAVFPVHGASLNRSALENIDFSGILQSGSNLTTETKKADEGFTTEIRREKLYNMCSRMHVRILRVGKKGVNAKGRKKSGRLNNLVFQNTAEGTIRIFGERTGFYICFNRRGKLVVRRKGNKKLCQFKEVADGDFSMYQAADEKYDWFMGFKRDGKPSKWHSKKDPKCFKFLKTDRTHVCSKKGIHGIRHCSMIKNGIVPNHKTPALRHRHSKHKEAMGG